ncbi:MAG: hypothetical protein H7841_13090 [Magnetospirillum sp. WYHS-4]
MRVLVIPEDFRKDQYILKPIVKALLEVLGKPRAKVEVCKDPLLGGVAEALKSERIAEILERYRGMVDLFLLCVDRDGLPGRRGRLNELEGEASPAVLIAENAWQELEAWVLAGHDLPKDWQWAAIRGETQVKEVYFEPFARDRGVASGPGGGRKALAEEAARRIDRIVALCPEDLGSLKTRIAAFA